MRLSLTTSPRRIARLTRNTPVVLRVLSGECRIGHTGEELLAGEGVPVLPADGVQNWMLPEGELWMAGAILPTSVEVLLP